VTSEIDAGIVHLFAVFAIAVATKPVDKLRAGWQVVFVMTVFADAGLVDVRFNGQGGGSGRLLFHGVLLKCI